MNLIKHYKTKQLLLLLFKLSIVVAAFYFIYIKLTENKNLQFSAFITFLDKYESFSFKTITFLILLSFFNWFFEILKWKNLVKSIKPISIHQATEQSLGGLTASLITPNRIGEYGAKAMYYTKPFRTKIVLLNLLGNLAQMIITTLLGCIGLLFFINRYSIKINYYTVLQYSVIVLLIGLLLLFLTKQNHFKIKGFSFRSVIIFLKSISLKTHLTNILYSLLRYILFSSQFYYLLIVFRIEISYFEAMTVITSMYLLTSIIPAISIFDFVIKGSIAVFLFSFLNVNELTILTITTLMWLFNFVLPSISGSYFVINFKLPKPVE
ncbi:flippase-like domain-containing protein [Winogradskyella undariae]|uniref:lysylphosphatidylglycerol synthase domain-containing protein n=1 Tax=Winogradskyella undariae TaxID=1285465 RepID=UPI00156BABD5|nr:lysylphosphatidylglycerol synthase domain-containing protein [Winogradskyella undariae]NRR90089.1 flippase-like domain-containing protein [Winogradskyella undariae]